MCGLLELRSSQGQQKNSLVTLYNSSATVKENGKICKIQWELRAISLICSFSFI